MNAEAHTDLPPHRIGVKKKPVELDLSRPSESWPAVSFPIDPILENAAWRFERH